MKKIETLKQNGSVEALNATRMENTKGGLLTFASIFGAYIPPMVDELTDKRRPPSTGVTRP